MAVVLRVLAQLKNPSPSPHTNKAPNFELYPDVHL